MYRLNIAVCQFILQFILDYDIIDASIIFHDTKGEITMLALQALRDRMTDEQKAELERRRQERLNDPMRRAFNVTIRTREVLDVGYYNADADVAPQHRIIPRSC
jgi:hypothetical protein